MVRYKIENEEVRKYFHEEYNKINVKVVPGHWPNFNTKDEVDEWIYHMKKLESEWDRLFNDDDEMDDRESI